MMIYMMKLTADKDPNAIFNIFIYFALNICRESLKIWGLNILQTYHLAAKQCPNKLSSPKWELHATSYSMRKWNVLYTTQI